MNYFVIQGILRGKTLYWNKKAWVKIEEAAKYKTRAIAKKRAEILTVKCLHRDFKTGDFRQVSVEEITVTYSIACKSQTYIGGRSQNVV